MPQFTKRMTGFEKLLAVVNEAAEKMKDDEFDERLTEGQLHHLVVSGLGAEPLLFAANVISLAVDMRSRVSMQPEKVIQAAFALHDRLYGAPKAKVKRVDAENQFRLDFAWSEGEKVATGDELEVTRVAADGTTITNTHKISEGA